MDDLTLFENRFEERLRAFAATGVKSVDSAAIARAVAAGHLGSVATGPNGGRVLDEPDARGRVVNGRRWRRSMFGRSLAAVAVVAVLVSGALLATRPEEPANRDPSPSLPGVVAPTPPSSATATDSPELPTSTGVWIPTGSMGTSRSGHDAVRLLDGRVLVVGGVEGAENETSAELYDPATGTWSATGSMLKPRGGFPTTLLRDGRVLVGDVDDPDADDPVMGLEVYDPSTGTWTASGAIVMDGTTTLLRDGTVLVRGNEGSQLYDPDSGTWTATQSRPAQRHSHAAVLLPDGRVLVTGGHVEGDTVTDTAELYDPATGSWTATASMTTPIYPPAATLLADGTVLVVGRSGDSDSTSAQVYDPATGSWTATGDLATPGASYESITPLADGTALVAGKVGQGPDHPAAALYDPVTGSWAATATMLRPHDRAPATLLLDGTVLVAGGGVAGDSSELYVPVGVTLPVGLPAGPAPTDPSFPQLTGAWVATGSMKTPRIGHTAVRLLDGRVLVAGGSNEAEEHMTSAELYDPKSGTWSATADMLRPTYGFPATLLLDGRVLVGHDNDPEAEDRNIGAEVYDPASGSWTATGKLISTEDFDCCETATLLRDGRVLVTGREGAQLFDPDTMTWTETGKPTTRGLGAGEAVLLPDGKVLVAGGGIYPQMLRSAALYDPDTGSWTATGDMNAPHDGPDSATLLRDGTVLVTGRSTSASSSRSAELYDPASGTWTVTGDMIAWDSNDRSATLLLDGTVLVIGPGSGPELYDPGTRSWSPFWTFLGAHDAAPATLLLDGRVLVAGAEGCSAETGLDECGITGAAVVYDPGATSTSAPPPRPNPVATPTPIPVPPEAGPGQPGGGPWKVTVSNNSPQPATLFVAEENEQGLMGRIVGSATPDVVPRGTTVEVTLLVSAEGARDWWIFVNPGSDNGSVLVGTDVPPTCTINVNQEGRAGWVCGS